MDHRRSLWICVILWAHHQVAVQQIQPLFISMICSAPKSSRRAINLSSIPISPNSFSITAKRLPCVSSGIPIIAKYNLIILSLKELCCKMTYVVYLESYYLSIYILTTSNQIIWTYSDHPSESSTLTIQNEALVRCDSAKWFCQIPRNQSKCVRVPAATIQRLSTLKPSNHESISVWTLWTDLQPLPDWSHEVHFWPCSELLPRLLRQSLPPAFRNPFHTWQPKHKPQAIVILL